MKIFKTFISFILILCLLSVFTVSAVQQKTGSAQSNEVPYQSYTYWVDYNTSEKMPVYSKPMYKTDLIVSAALLGADENSKLNDVAIDSNGKTYVLDSGNSRIYVLDANYKLISTIKNIKYGGKPLTFTDAQGVYVDAKGIIYVCDTENARVICFDKKGEVEQMLVLPESELIPTEFKYRPVKVAVDSKGYTYIASEGSYYGAILYSPKMEFLGFFGANTVKSTPLDVLSNLWKRLTSNDIKRAADEISLPYAFTDIVVGPADFVYTSTGKGTDNNVQTGQICVLNPGGKNIIADDGKNFADYKVGYHLFATLSQNMNNLDVDSDGLIYTLDKTYGRIFWYDSECNLFSVFGGSAGQGEQKGTFSLPSAIAVNGTDVLVTDSYKNTLTIFKLTEYGALVRSAQLTTLSGDFSAALEGWEAVISQDTNCQLAYRGLGKAYYDKGDNKTAMKYAKMGVDRDTYAKAFEVQRTELLENNFHWIFIGIAVVVALAIFYKLTLGKRKVKLIKNKQIKLALSSVAHPVESFQTIKEKGQGSVIIGAVILLLFYIITVLNDTTGGFAFTVFDSENYSAIYVLLSTVGLVLLFTISNWLICTLAGGIGKLKEIFIVTCYSLIPMVAFRLLRIVLTHVLIPDEAAFLNVFAVLCLLYTLFMLIIGIMRVHDYEFGKFIATTIVTIIGMVIIVFLLFLTFMLIQQVLNLVSTVYIEIRYR
ncbi:MAG: YIP1 family protein [Clostridia bacterium]|nr:YIP1 family protein [Clostridia bacterium]